MNDGRLPELKIGYEPDGSPKAAVCSLCGEWMEGDIPKTDQPQEIITAFTIQFKAHVKSKHPYLVSN